MKLTPPFFSNTRFSYISSPIEYLAFSDNLEELNYLNSIVENAEVVGLGEAHHTVGGYHRMIARSSKYMIERLGFTEVALETPWEHAEALTNYVNNCDRDDPLPAMQTIFSQFASEEILELFKWIRLRNCKENYAKVGVFGFDTQEANLRYRYDHSAVYFYLPVVLGHVKNFPESLDSANLAKLKYCGKTSNADSPIPSNSQQLASCHEALSSLGQYINQNESLVIKQVGRSIFNKLRYSMISLWANAGQTANSSEDFSIRQGWRDRGMGKLFTTIRRDRGSKKTIVIAHMGHIAKLGEVFMPFSYDPKNLGSILSDTYGSKYRTIGFLANSFEFQSWHNERSGTGPYIPSQGSLETDLLSLTIKKGLVFNFGQSELFPDVDVSAREVIGLPIGGKIRSHFDGLVFLPKAWKMQPINGVKYTDK